MAKTLVIYYSRKGQNYVSGSIKKLKKGNTEICAEFIRDAVGADLFEVDTVKPYSEEYHTSTKEAKAELRDKARPELKTYLENIDEYENIVVAGPCWWGTYPMPIFSQIERLDFTGKNVFALITHEGSRLGSSERDLKEYCKDAKFGQGLAIHGTGAEGSSSKVAAWAKKNLM